MLYVHGKYLCERLLNTPLFFCRSPLTPEYLCHKCFLGLPEVYPPNNLEKSSRSFFTAAASPRSAYELSPSVFVSPQVRG